MRRAGVVVCALLAVISCRRTESELQRQSRLMMDTYVTITASGPRADSGIAAAFSRLADLERKFNHLDTASPLHAFNAGLGPLEDSELVAVVAAAVEVSRETGGAFDVTVEPLVRLWGFYDGKPAVPSLHGIDSCLALVGYGKLAVEPGRIAKLDPAVRIDLGAIAKGYAVGAAAEAMKSAGVSSGLVDAGGDVFAFGARPDGEWRVGIRNPRGEDMLGVLEVRDKAVVTSGDYERFFFGTAPGPGSTWDGSGHDPNCRAVQSCPVAGRLGHVPAESVRYCHIIDARTGWPARGVASVTVVGDDPARADAWSTAAFVLGPAGVDIAAREGKAEVLMVPDSGPVLKTAGFDRLLRRER